MSSYTDIVNLALNRLGAKRIENLLSDNSKRAIRARDLYEQVRDELLSRHPWTFAIGRAQLVVTANTPDFQFDYEYQLPTDHLATWDFVDSNGDHLDVEWSEEGDKILTNEDEAYILYIKKVTDSSKFSRTFIKSYYLTLASEMSYDITQDKTLKSTLFDEAEMAAIMAQHYSSRGTKAEQMEADDFIDVRF